jgi:hypothetical protein
VTSLPPKVNISHSTHKSAKGQKRTLPLFVGMLLLAVSALDAGPNPSRL